MLSRVLRWLGLARAESGELLPSERERGGKGVEAAGRRTGGTLDLILGLDFGTSCTKAVVRTPYEAGGRAYPIQFPDSGHLELTHLVPSRIGIDEGRVAIGREVSGSAASGLKRDVMRWVSMQDSGEIERYLAPSTLFLSGVIREACRSLLSSYPRFGNYSLRWQMNLGVPSAGYDDGAARTAFRAVAVSAWRLAQGDGIPRLPQAAETVTRVLEAGTGGGDPVDVFPEVIAEAVGYARSPHRDPGLHLIVDVGGSTLDVCSFVLHEKDGEDQYSLLTADVRRLGGLILHRRRLNALRGCSDGTNVEDPMNEPFLRLEDRVEAFCQSPSVEQSAAFQEVGEQYESECTLALMSTLVAVKRSRDPHSDRWRSRLPVFLCGGGRRLPTFERALSVAHAQFCQNWKAQGLERLTLPVPEGLAEEGVGDEVFARLAVAYGLAFDTLDVGAVRSPSEILDVPEPRVRDYRRDFVDKDMV